jgi:hypothetical protein
MSDCALYIVTAPKGTALVHHRVGESGRSVTVNINSYSKNNVISKNIMLKNVVK